MPLYTFKCPTCKKEKEVLQKTSKPPMCDAYPCKLSTGIEMKRILFKSTGKPQFKGSGFYETDYKKKGGG